MFCAVPDPADSREGVGTLQNWPKGGIILICDGVFAALYPCLPPWRRVGVTLPLGKSEVHFGSERCINEGRSNRELHIVTGVGQNSEE